MRFKSHGGRKNRATGQQPKRWTKRNNASRQGLVDKPSSDAPASAMEQPLETSPELDPGEIDVKSLELSDSLMRFVDDDRDSSIQPETEPDGSKRFHILDAYASTAGNPDEVGNEVIVSGTEQATELAQDERRKHPREYSSDLVWVEYFNSSMESIGREGARVENFGGGGMRVATKAAPPELERVIVSYPYRGFESCSIVRSKYQGENSQEHLCLEFADKEWKVNATYATAENSADQVNPRKILLADDDAAFRKILGNILIKAGYDVVLAEDGESAVEKATRENPDLVITDGLMPKLNGFQVCKAVKELNPQPRVIILTAVYTSPTYMWEAKTKFGADDIITKPCQIGDLLRKIEKHMPPPVMSSDALFARPPVDIDTFRKSAAS